MAFRQGGRGVPLTPSQGGGHGARGFTQAMGPRGRARRGGGRRGLPERSQRSARSPAWGGGLWGPLVQLLGISLPTFTQ